MSISFQEKEPSPILSLQKEDEQSPLFLSGTEIGLELISKRLANSIKTLGNPHIKEKCPDSYEQARLRVIRGIMEGLIKTQYYKAIVQDKNGEFAIIETDIPSLNVRVNGVSRPDVKNITVLFPELSPSLSQSPQPSGFHSTHSGSSEMPDLFDPQS